MRVAVISDTHMPRAATLLAAGCREALARADAIVHAGDFSEIEVLEGIRALGPPVIAVRGNIDDEAVHRALPESVVFDAGGLRIALLHDTGPERGRAARMARRFPDADGVIFGHSHIPLHQPADGGPWLLNPGSPTDRRRQPHHTMAVLTIEERTPAVEFLMLDGDTASPLPDALVRGRARRAE